ncbi:hypothetical protein GCM10023178_05410 [Actinomadura luteofluorescens]
MLALEDLELAEGVEQVTLVPDQRAVAEFAAQVGTHRSITAFTLGIRTPVMVAGVGQDGVA